MVFFVVIELAIVELGVICYTEIYNEILAGAFYHE